MEKKVFAIIALFLLIPLALAVIPTEREQYRECNADCRIMKTAAQTQCASDFTQCRADCGRDRTCLTTCGRERTTCIREANLQDRECKKECKEIIAPKCTFEGNIYKAGESFENGCDRCECKSNGRLSCKKDAFCNKNPEVPQTLCEESGGLYHALCNGPYFDNFCSQHKYCLCDGVNEYTCPADHECLKEFTNPNVRRTGTIPGWRDMFGTPLGDVGVCVH